MIPAPSAKLPQNVSAPNELDVTIPLTPPPQLSTSPPVVSASPLLQCSSPSVVQQPGPAPLDTPCITARVIRHESPHSDHEPPIPMATGGREDWAERHNSPEGTGYWGSLPQQEEVEGKEDGSQRGRVGEREEHGPQQDSPEVFGNRVEQLTKMVEKLSAKFVLLETQLKLSQSHPELGPVERAHSSCFESVSKGGDASREKQPLRDITSQQLVNQQHSSPVNCSPVKLTVTAKQTQPESPKLSASCSRTDYAQQYTPHSVRILHTATPSTPVCNLLNRFHCKVFTSFFCRRKQK